MIECVYVVDKIANSLMHEDVNFKENMTRIGAIDKNGERVKGFVVEGDIVTGRLLCPRKAKGDRVFFQDIGWPNSVSIGPDPAGCDEGSAALLYGLCRGIAPRVVFETGTHKGRSTKAIVKAICENRSSGRITTVDQYDYGVISDAKPSIFSDDELSRITKVVGKTPDILSSPELDHVWGIDFAHLDGAHDGTITDELNWVESRASENCLVLIDNVMDDCWPEMTAALNAYTKYPRITIPTMCGYELIWMHVEKTT